MANPKIIPKKSTVAAKQPTTSDLALGEIAINYADSKLYARHPVSGVVQEIGGGASSAINTIARAAWDSPYHYYGIAPSGTIESSSGWSITRIATNSNGSITSSASTFGIWNNRTSLSYL